MIDYFIPQATKFWYVTTSACRYGNKNILKDFDPFQIDYSLQCLSVYFPKNVLECSQRAYYPYATLQSGKVEAIYTSCISDFCSWVHLLSVKVLLSSYRIVTDYQSFVSYRKVQQKRVDAIPNRQSRWHLIHDRFRDAGDEGRWGLSL